LVFSSGRGVLAADSYQTNFELRKEFAAKAQNGAALIIQKKLNLADYSVYWTGFTEFISSAFPPPVAMARGSRRGSRLSPRGGQDF